MSGPSIVLLCFGRDPTLQDGQLGSTREEGRDKLR